MTYKSQFTQYKAKLVALSNLEADLDEKRKEIPTLKDQLEESRERLTALEGQVKEYFAKEIGDIDLPGVSKAVEKGNYRQAYEMLQGLDEEEELDELLSAPVVKVGEEPAEPTVETETKQEEKGKNLCFLLDVIDLSYHTISDLKKGVEEMSESFAEGNERKYMGSVMGYNETGWINDFEWLAWLGSLGEQVVNSTLRGITKGMKSQNYINLILTGELDKVSSFDTLLVTSGYYGHGYKDKQVIEGLKSVAEKGNLTVLYLGRKDPDPKINPEIMQMSEFATVKCLPRYASKQGDIEDWLVAYARNIIEEEKSLLVTEDVETKAESEKQPDETILEDLDSEDEAERTEGSAARQEAEDLGKIVPDKFRVAAPGVKVVEVRLTSGGKK